MGCAMKNESSRWGKCFAAVAVICDFDEIEWKLKPIVNIKRTREKQKKQIVRLERTPRGRAWNAWKSPDTSASGIDVLFMQELSVCSFLFYYYCLHMLFTRKSNACDLYFQRCFINSKCRSFALSPRSVSLCRNRAATCASPLLLLAPHCTSIKNKFDIEAVESNAVVSHITLVSPPPPLSLSPSSAHSFVHSLFPLHWYDEIVGWVRQHFVEHQFNSLSIGLKAYKCGIFKMKMAVIYINLWYFECDNNNNTLNNNVFWCVFDRFHVYCPQGCVLFTGPTTTKRSITRKEKSEAGKKRQICYRKVGDAILSHIHFVWFSVASTLVEQPMEEKNILHRRISLRLSSTRANDCESGYPTGSLCVSPSNVTHHDQQCEVHNPNWNPLYLCWTDAKRREKKKQHSSATMNEVIEPTFARLARI